MTIFNYIKKKFFKKEEKEFEYPVKDYKLKEFEQRIYRYKIRADFGDEEVEFWHDSFSQICLENLGRLNPRTIMYDEAEVPENSLYLFNGWDYLSIYCPIDEDDDYLVNLNNACELEIVEKIKIVLEAEAVYEVEVRESGREEVVELDGVVEEPGVVEREELEGDNTE